MSSDHTFAPFESAHRRRDEGRTLQVCQIGEVCDKIKDCPGITTLQPSRQRQRQTIKSYPGIYLSQIIFNPFWPLWIVNWPVQ